MDRTERFYRIDRLLRARQSTPLAALIDDLGVSRATVKRDIEYLRDRFNAPIVWDRGRRGYRYEVADGAAWSLPGLWFNASEARALITMDHLLSGLQPGLLEPHVAPLRERIRALLGGGERDAAEVVRRIRVLHLATRTLQPRHFEVVAAGVLERRRLALQHYNRASGDTTRREVSPQRLVYYRDNWYLDAWCHLRGALRSFAVDALGEAELSDAAAVDIDEERLEAQLGAGYGIFAGPAVARAELRFSPLRARWVSREFWHPQQQGRFDAGGYYLLSVPYADDRELIMDILRHGAEVEVLAPAELRERVRAELRRAADGYGG